MIVIDTHALIWYIEADPKLGAAARAIIDDATEADAALIPAMCVWELAYLERRQSVELSADLGVWIERVLDRNGFHLVQMEPRIAISSVRLDWSHKDPADRMIVATAQSFDAPLVTADSEILAYAAAGHVQAIDARR